MISRTFQAAALACALALGGCIGSDTPEEQLKTIEELQTKKLPMTEKQASEMADHLAKGREALSAGNKEAAGKAFDKALEILKIAEDTALYNKAD